MAALALALAAALVSTASADAATLYLSPSGSDAASCGASTPCKTFDRAYRVAAPGDVVEVAAGTYGSEAIPALGRSAPAIEFRAADGATVTLAGLAVRADDVIVRGVRVQTWASVDSGNTADPVERVTFSDVHTSKHWLNNGRDFLWKGGSIGPSFNEKASMIGGAPASQRLTYDGVTWHDATRNDQSVHMECFYVASVQGLTVRNSRFTNCAVFDVLITRMATDAQPRDIVFENNVFERSRDIGAASAYYTLAIHSNVTLNSLVLRNNVWEQPISIGGVMQSGRAVGNIGAGGWDGGCQAGITYSYNVFTTKACGPNDRVDANAFSQFVNPAGGDWRLKAGATATDAGHPTDYPATDAAGNARNGAPDAGAFEYGGTYVPPQIEPTPDPAPAPAPAPGADTQSPSVPQGMAWTTKTQTSLGLRWDPATDNVGVTGYRLYVNDKLAATTTQTSYTLGGLTCNTSYTVGLTAIDAAGNESYRPEATGTTTTGACETAPAPTDGGSTGGTTGGSTGGTTGGGKKTGNGGGGGKPPRDRTLAGAWSFDEAAGLVVTDSSGAGNVGTVSGAGRVSGRHGGALEFDGVDDMVTVPHSKSLSLARRMTIEAWVKPTDLGSAWQPIAVKEARRGSAYSLYASDKWGKPRGQVAARRAVAASMRLQPGRWAHVAATWNGRVLRLHVNGVQVARHRVLGARSAARAALQFGASTTRGHFFAGLIDDVRIYRRALTVREIRADMRRAV